MKTLVGLVTLVFMACAGIVLAPADAQDGPTAIVHGRDACDGCRMRLDRPGYAAQLKAGGGVRFYDDVGCLARDAATRDAAARVWIEDHLTGELVPLCDATLVRSDQVRTPMGSGVVGFRDPVRAAAHRDRMHGEFVTLERLAAGRGEERS